MWCRGHSGRRITRESKSKSKENIWHDIVDIDAIGFNVGKFKKSVRNIMEAREILRWNANILLLFNRESIANVNLG